MKKAIQLLCSGFALFVLFAALTVGFTELTHFNVTFAGLTILTAVFSVYIAYGVLYK
ncbi:hypothetical protein SAMN05216232_1969 [Virgibacillus subterraneus]|uniref:Uncharacterized protein n=1 Tax=Virgibacillus subterraneus TaxID=621109 RepID=A0A1H9EBB7_9BACI|nr:hypothetical protein [Virgibacillus subterraneus]SEQ23001.1 hypothetical protein SAMN05216232_1969 [Virgibacillus subterraneus]